MTSRATPIEFSVIVETYNLKEDSDWDRFRASLGAAIAMIPEDRSAEVLVADAYGSLELEKMLAEEFPQVLRVAATGLSYDRAKAMAAQAASGHYVLFLDGDCIPDPNWHHRLLEVLRSGEAVACGGYTRYEGGFLAAIMSVMDFGFLYPRVARELKCYASNSCGFLRETLEEVPVPEADMRCCCYYHAQLLLRRGTPVQLVPEVQVLHDLPPILRERSRRGYDTIAACWADAELSEARWLRLGILSLPLFYAMNVLLDWKRVWIGRKDLELSPWQVLFSSPLFPLFRLLDAAGMVRAFTRGPTKGGWGGF